MLRGAGRMYVVVLGEELRDTDTPRSEQFGCAIQANAAGVVI